MKNKFVNKSETCHVKGSLKSPKIKLSRNGGSIFTKNRVFLKSLLFKHCLARKALECVKAT